MFQMRHFVIFVKILVLKVNFLCMCRLILGIECIYKMLGQGCDKLVLKQDSRESFHLMEYLVCNGII